MNTLPDDQLIEEVALLMGISEAYVEKDWYLTQVISLLADDQYRMWSWSSQAGPPCPRPISSSSGFPKILISGLWLPACKAWLARLSRSDSPLTNSIW